MKAETTYDWFTKRGLKVLNYQSDVLRKIKANMQKQDVTILAACPSAGKTIMAIYCIEDYLIEHPSAKVLVLTHGTTILRTQFNDVLNEVHPGFSYNMVEKFTQFKHKSQVNVCLPQTLCGKNLPHIDLLVVDEAHQFYFADMVQNIIKLINPDKQLLLTGTPSVFIAKNYPIIAVPLITIYDEGMTADVRVEIATSSYNFDIIGDYNNDNELKGDVEILESETKKTLDELLKKIIVKLGDNNIRTWTQSLKELKKTMFACRSQKQAKQIKSYFDNTGIKSALSVSDTDTDSLEIQRFKAEDDCLILIVVGRGILGFNYTKLVNIVDMSTSQNIDRIYQLFCRIVRKHPDGVKKFFFKIAPREKSDYYKYIMTGVLALSAEEFFIKFNGKNFGDLQIPVIENKKKYDYKSAVNKQKCNKPRIYEPINFDSLPVFEFFKDVYGNDNTLSTYTLTNINDVRAEFLNRKPNGYWNLENCLKSASRYGLVAEWKHNEPDAFNASKINGWYADCLKVMTTNLKERMIETQKKKSFWKIFN